MSHLISHTIGYSISIIYVKLFGGFLMELDVNIGGESLSINIENPFRLEIDDIMTHIGDFVMARGAKINGLNIEGLIPRMVRGIAGCEGGCPADAKSLVSKGYDGFEIEYVEGGILSAKISLDKDQLLELKMFPEF
jgi:hypothetical protein